MDKRILLETVVGGGIGIVLGTVAVLVLAVVLYVAALIVLWTKDIVEDARRSRRRKIWETDVAENVGAKLFPSRKDAEKWIAANPGLDYKMWGTDDGVIVRYGK